MHKISSRINSILFRIAGEENRDFLIILLSWKSIVGEILELRTKLVKYEKNVLYVKVANHVWLQELVLCKSEILEKLREKTGIHIDNIYFTI